MPDNDRMPLAFAQSNLDPLPSGSRGGFAPAQGFPVGRFAGLGAGNQPHFPVQNRVDLQQPFASDVQKLVPETANSAANSSGKLKTMKVQEIVRIARGPVQMKAPVANACSEILVTT